MKLTSTVISLAALFSLAPVDSAAKVTAYHNTKYDDGDNPTSSVICGDDPSAPYQTLGKLPNFPNIGGYQNTDCGSCWAVAYDTVTTIYVLIVDGSNKGLQLSLQTMTNLGKTSGIHGEPYSTLDVTVTEADKSKCGL